MDPTGAGDSFAGGLLGYLASCGLVTPASLRKALFFAAALGSFCVEGVGPTRLLAIDRSDVAARIAAFARLVDYGGDLVVPG
jgi:sugar/nucleoside kinase (ribokinase family)